MEATKWYQAAFASLTSHAAGIVGFVGFQKIVVARCRVAGSAGWLDGLGGLGGLWYVSMSLWNVTKKAHDLSLPSSHASLMTARIVSASDICNWWSLSNFLLYTTLALSIVGMSASFVWCSQRKLL